MASWLCYLRTSLSVFGNFLRHGVSWSFLYDYRALIASLLFGGGTMLVQFLREREHPFGESDDDD